MKKLTVFLGCSVLTTALFAAPSPVEIPAMNAPQLDGVLSDSEWSKAIQFQLVPVAEGRKVTQTTVAYAGCDKKNLYVAFRCDEAQPEKMRRVHTHMEERDSNIYEDDCVEIFFELSGNKKPNVFHFAINSCGLVYDAWNGDTGFQSDIKVACKVEKDYWIAEIKIPFSDLGVTPHGAEVFSMNLGRERHNGPEYSCLVSGEGSFLDLCHFLTFRPMPPDAVKDVPVTILGFGSLNEPGLRIVNTSETDADKHLVTVETLDVTMNRLRMDNTETKPGKAETIYKYNVGGKTPAAALRITIPGKQGGKYTSTYLFPKGNTENKVRVMKIEKPLCEELYSDVLPKQRDFHGFQWIFGAGQAGYMNMFALQNALPYSVRDIGKEHKDTGMALYSNAKMIDWMKKEVFAEEFDTPIVAMPRPLQKEVNTEVSYNIFVLPKQRAVYLNDVKNMASDKKVRGITFADEVSECIDAGLIEAFAKYPDDPDLKAFDTMIKQKYGKGKYGIPASLNESDPYALIAYRRALNDELVSLYREAAKLARSINPDVLIISDDPVGSQNRLYSFGDQRGIYDIVTHQLYPRANPNLDEFGFLTRYVGDLTGSEVWPCPHVEEYGASFTPEEVLYELSATVRNGARGFHYYLDDSTGTRSGVRYLIHERWGAPDRYAVELNAQHFLKTMPMLKFPVRDSALFTATDTLRAASGAMFHNHVDTNMYLHTFLGYGAGVSYRYINESTMENLEQYKFIVTAESKYLPRETFEALQSYVKKGGTLLVFNPSCFSFTIDGESLAEAQKKFTGVTVEGNSDNPRYFTYGGTQVEVSALPCVKFATAPKAKVLASFANGDPAMVENKVGKGRVISLAANPCVARLAGNASWKTFFHTFAKKCNAKVDCDIWRFQLPDSLLPKTVEVPGVCITNNAVRMEHFNVVRINGSDLTGSYTLTPNPDYSKDCKTGEISFAEGKLTDRPRARVAGACVKEKSIWTDWAVAWKENQPITISAKWSEPASITSVKLLVGGTWGDATLEIGGKKYAFPCPADFNRDTLSVREVVMTLPAPVKSASLTIHIAPVPKSLTIAEMEIWGE